MGTIKVKEKIANKHHDGLIIQVKKRLESVLEERSWDKPLTGGKKVQVNMKIGGTTYHVWVVRRLDDSIRVIEIKR